MTQYRNFGVKKSHGALSHVLKDLPAKAVLTYSLSKDEDDSFGITIVGGLGSLCDGIYIQSISSSGICGMDGSLQVGDQILELNGKPMMNLTHEEAIEVFLNCKSDIQIVVSRMIDRKLFRRFRNSSYRDKMCVNGNFNEEPIVLEHKPL